MAEEKKKYYGPSSVKWTPENLTVPLRKAIAQGLTAGAALLADTMARNMGSEGGKPTGMSDVVSFTTKKGKQVTFKLNKARMTYEAAKPGHFPGIRTGNLRNSITYEGATSQELAARAGTVLGAEDKYGLWLEYGTKKMAARPWALRSLMQNKPQILAIMTRVAKNEFYLEQTRQGASK